MEILTYPIIIIALVEVLKRVANVGSTAPIWASVLGVGVATAHAYFTGGQLDVHLVDGLVTGFTASGAYDVAKRIIRGVVDAAVGDVPEP